MLEIQPSNNFYKKPGFILILILVVFFLKGVFLATVIPMLQGQDEARHYVTIQYLAESKKAREEMPKKKGEKGDGFERYHSSEEFGKTVQAASLDSYSGNDYEKILFSDTFDGYNEPLIESNDWNKNVEAKSSSVVEGGKLYHTSASFIEKIFKNKTVLFRFYLIRIFSVLLGTLGLFFAYFLIKNTGISAINSLLITAIISFQPKFSEYTTNINYDALLIPLFILFTLGCVLFLKNGPNLKNILIILISLTLGILTKGTAIILFIPLSFLILFQLLRNLKKGSFKLRYLFILLIIIAAGLIIIFEVFGVKKFMPDLNSEMGIVEFLKANLERFEYTYGKYWSEINWLRVNFSEYFVKAILYLEGLSLLGIILFLISRKPLKFLPKKRYVIFFILMLLSLQFGILFNNWKITTQGGEVLIQSPGRYFIPNIVAHITLLAIGLGAIFRKESLFRFVLKLILIFMLTFNLYLLFGIMIPRFYF